jgi:putative membrane protein
MRFAAKPFIGRGAAAAVLLVLTGLVAVPVAAAGTPAGSPSAPVPPSTQDRSYLADTAQTNLAELKMAAVALQRSGTAAVRGVATTITQDHTQAQTELAAVAAPLGFTLPARPNPAQQTQLAQLRTVPPADFDTTYLQMQVNDHTVAIAATQAEIASGTNQAVVDYAKTTVSMLQKHLRMASRAEHSRAVDAEGPQPAAATLGAGGPAPVAAVVTTGPLAHGAKATGSDDAPWLIALVVVIGLGLAGGLLWLRRAAAPKH